MASHSTALAACLLALLQLTAVSAGTCDGMSYVKGLDESPTGGNAGKCTSAIEAASAAGSNWCKGPALTPWPNGQNAKAKSCMKFGRMTAYRGPIGGSSPAQKAACNKMLAGSSDMAMVAVSTKYLKTYQGGWATDKGTCNKCMCIRIHGADKGSNPGLQTDAVSPMIGMSFMGQVGDRCSECEDDHIDILQDRPFSWAPFSPGDKSDQWAPWANSLEGYRAFSNPQFIRGAKGSPESVGIWVADWQWAPCTYSHSDCANMMKKMDYSTSFAPKYTNGYNSLNMRDMASARTAPFNPPWQGASAVSGGR